MRFEITGRPPDGPTLDLDHREFAYAGKFVMSSTGKSVARDGDEVVGAVAFSEDRSDPDAVRLRYVTVREDRRSEGIGPRLLRFTAVELAATYDRVLIAVNNPIAYQACYRAGFGFTGEGTGMAELLMCYQPEERGATQYTAGLRQFADRELPDAHRAVLDRRLGTDPPPLVEIPE